MNYLHSGSLGDIVFSIPTIKALNGKFGKGNLYLKADVPDSIPAWAGQRQHFRMNRAEAESLIPLLSGQTGFGEVALYDGQPIDVDLDQFRQTGFPFDRGDISRYYAYAFKVCGRTWEQWLRVDPSDDYKGCVLVNRTNRYRNKSISYDFLAGKPKVISLGYKDESLPRTPHVKAPNARVLASWIAGCKLFVGNQSFCFSLAEAMKTPRVLEVYPAAPNMPPNGPKGWEAIDQQRFEEIVLDLSK